MGGAKTNHLVCDWAGLQCVYPGDVRLNSDRIWQLHASRPVARNATIQVLAKPPIQAKLRAVEDRNRGGGVNVVDRRTLILDHHGTTSLL